MGYWGACEPLGQALVVPAVARLAEMGVRFTLVTFEKAADLQNDDLVRRVRDTFHGCKIRWIPLRYHKRPRIPATAFDIAHGWMRGLVEQLDSPYDLIHARTFICGLTGMALAPVLRTPWVYHNEGFYPDEQVDAGVFRGGSLPHRIGLRLEREMYGRADGLVVLSRRAERVVRQIGPVVRKATPVIVVPSCVNLDTFGCREREREGGGNGLKLIYIGSIGGRYIFDRVARFVAVACRLLPSVRLRVLTKLDPVVVGSLLKENGVPESVFSVASVSHAAVPEELQAHDAGLFFLSNGISEHGCSPTKVGEYWACGLPVVTTANVSDLDEIIARDRVGVIIREHSEPAYTVAVRQLQELFIDPDLRTRCRRAAEENYSLEAGCERQLRLYQQLAGR
jgi:glycosyltransferase involved in cell wall biosynthesis